jgi:glycosyltransferase involved in cell wall biosynthesis
LHAGFSHARGEIIITLDGDGQNDPGDFPGLIERLFKEKHIKLGYRFSQIFGFL